MAQRREPAGGVFMVGLPGATLDEETAERLRSLAPAGVILFRRNLDSPEQALALLARLRGELPSPALFAVDQEGGRVSRLEPWIGRTPSAAALAGHGEESAGRYGQATGLALASLGFNLDFAPVVDLCGPEAANGIGDRAWSSDPREATRLAGAFLRALQGTGVAGCLKHFPGLGDSRVDSHLALPRVERALERIEREDLLPYRELGPDAACIMIGHGHYPALDPQEELPATCSPRIVTGLLREKLGFRGLVVSDDLEMGAVAPRDRSGAAAVEALAAGCDLLLYCSDLERAAAAARAIARAAEQDPALAHRLDTARAAVRGFAARWPAPPAGTRAWTRAAAGLEPFTRLS